MKSTINQVSYNLKTFKYKMYLEINGEQVAVDMYPLDAQLVIDSFDDYYLEFGVGDDVVYYISQG